MKDYQEFKKWNHAEHKKFEEQNIKQQIMLEEMKTKVDEIYQWVTTGKLGYFGILKFFAFVGVVSGGIIGAMSLFKKLFK